MPDRRSGVSGGNGDRVKLVNGMDLLALRQEASGLRMAILCAAQITANTFLSPTIIAD